MTAAGSRLLAQRLAAPLTDPARDRAPARCGRRLRRRRRGRAPMRARLQAAPDLARALSRLVLGRGGPRDLAAMRDGLAAARGLAPTRSASAKDGPAEIADALAACRAPIRRSRSELDAALWPTSCRCFKRDGGFVRAGYDERARRDARACATNPAASIAALQARYADETGIRALEDPAQQRARLFRRGDGAARRQADGAAAQRDLHPSPDARRAGALHHDRTRRTGSQDRQRRRPRARARAGDLRAALRARSSAQSEQIKACAEALAVLDVVGGAGAARGRARLRAPAGRRHASPSRSRAAAIRWSSRRCRATARRSSPTTATCRRRQRHERRAHLAAHRPEHGRQIDVPAPERADRRAGADGLVRAGASARISASSTACSRASAPPTISRAAARPSWSRWSRPPRSSIRPASARWSSSTRSAAAPRPSTACRSPGRRSSICTRTTAAARCSPRISTN